MNICYVCTNYNNSEYTFKAIESLILDEDNLYKIVVIDNNSNLSEVGLLKNLLSTFECVDIIFNDVNVGYFGGLNLGLNYIKSLKLTFDWVIVGNNDLLFPANFSSQLSLLNSELINHPVVSPDIVTIEGEHQNPHVISNISRVREIFYDIYFYNYFAGIIIKMLSRTFAVFTRRSDMIYWRKPGFIYQGHGSCYLLGPNFFKIFHELWAPTFLMSEEFFLSKQLSDAGFKIYYEPAIQVIHHWHGSLEKLPSRQRWEFARNAHREYRKYVKWL